MDRMARVEEIVLRMEDLVHEAELPRFDRVRYDIGAEEVWFYWDEQQFATVVELTAAPAELTSAMAAAFAGSGNPVLN